MDVHSETLADLVEGLRPRGDKPAIVQADADRVWHLTYDTLATDVARYAEGLASAGLTADDRVLLFAAGGPDWITAFLAIVATGAVAVPLDTQTDEETLRHIVEDSKARWSITDDARQTLLEGAGFSARVLRLDDADNGDSWRNVKADAADGGPRVEFEPDATAVLFYTSGTTGPPKGVPLSHRNLAFQLRAIVEAGLVDNDDIVLQPLPPHHVYPLVVGTLAPLALGLTIVIPEAMLGPAIVRAIQAGNVTFIVGVPRLYDALIDAITARINEAPAIARVYLRNAYRLSRFIRQRCGWRLGKILLYPLHRRLGPKLKVLASGGAALSPETALGIEALGWQVASGYGLTETSPLLTINPPGSRRLDSCGRAVPGIELRIAASDTGDDDGDGAPDGGEVLARGDGVFDGYLNHERDEDSFTADGWFRTKDLGRIDNDGFLTITGRSNTLLVTGAGKNIQPDSLESRYASDELIQEIGVLMDSEQLAAVVVPNIKSAREQNVSPENAVRMALSRRAKTLPSYQRVARHVLSREPLPRTRLGKIQRHKLAEHYRNLIEDPNYQSQLSDPIDITDMDPSDQAVLENEHALTVWELLTRRYPKHGLTPDSDLHVDLGIDSLGWLELGTELAERLGLRLDEEQIATVSTVRDLLELASGSDADDTPADSPIENPGHYLSAEQRRWLEPLSPAARLTANGLYAIHRAGIRLLFRLRIEGLEHVPTDRQWILAPNHASFLDPSVIAAALPSQVLPATYWAGWTGYAFRNAVFRTVSRLAQTIPVDPERAASSSLAFAAAVLENGKNLVIFPEGERSATGELLELKPGVGLLAAHFDEVAIVPAWISGSLEAWPRDRSLPRFHRISVRFGKALAPRQLIDETRDGIAPADAVTAGLRTALEKLGD